MFLIHHANSHYNLPNGYYFAAKHIGELRLKDILNLNIQLFGLKVISIQSLWCSKNVGWICTFFWHIIGQPVDHMSTQCFLTFRIMSSLSVYAMETRKFSLWLTFSTKRPEPLRSGQSFHELLLKEHKHPYTHFQHLKSILPQARLRLAVFSNKFHISSHFFHLYSLFATKSCS